MVVTLAQCSTVTGPVLYCANVTTIRKAGEGLHVGCQYARREPRAAEVITLPLESKISVAFYLWCYSYAGADTVILLDQGQLRAEGERTRLFTMYIFANQHFSNHG